MEFHRVSEKTLNGNLWTIFLWISIESTVFYGVLWNPLTSIESTDFYGMLWNSMESTDFYGMLWNSIESTDFYGMLWNSIEINGFSIEPIGNLHIIPQCG